MGEAMTWPPRQFSPLAGNDFGEERVARGGGRYFREVQAIGQSQSLLIKFGAPDDEDVPGISGETERLFEGRSQRRSRCVVGRIATQDNVASVR